MSSSFISTSSVPLSVKYNFISDSSFIGFTILDIAIMVGSFIVWRLIWYPIKMLKIYDITTRQEVRVGQPNSLVHSFKCLYKMLKNIGDLDCYIEKQCGYQAYTYLYFLRRFSQVMGILLMTDICVWIPYMLFFQPLSSFSLVTMPSDGNSMFRTFYTLWVAVVVLHGISSMRIYLRANLKSKLFCQGTQDQRIMNSLKSKTVHVHFVASPEITSLELKTKLIDEYKIEDRIIAFKRIDNQTVMLQLEYRLQVKRIVSKMMDPLRLSKLWQMFKAESNEQAERLLREDLAELNQLNQPIRLRPKDINSFFVVFSSIETAQDLCNEFQTTKALSNTLPSFGYGYESTHNHRQKSTMIVKWAQQPKDIMWINMGPPEKVQMIKYILFNLLSVLLLIIDLSIIVISSSHNVIELPKVLGPLILVITNAILKLLICKATQWENKLFQNQLQIKQFRMLVIYFIINALLGSIVRDTLNLLDILQTGWGWLSLLGLIYKQTDGYFYYLFLLNQITLSVFGVLVQIGNLIPEVFQAQLLYQKMTTLRNYSKYGTNDPFRFGNSYASDVVCLAIILMYSASNPLLHLFGLGYFLTRFYTGGYMLTFFHKGQQTCSNLRLIQKISEYIEIIVVSWIFLTATTMMFDGEYSNVLILYVSLGGIMYWILQRKNKLLLKDHAMDAQLMKCDLKSNIQNWKKIYQNQIVELQKTNQS